MNIEDKAMLIAIEAHGGDRNKHDGEMYLLHVARVVTNVKDAGGGYVERAVAWLHDVYEDTPMSLNDIRSCLIGNDYDYDLSAIDIVINAVDSLSKRSGESNEDYYERVKRNDVARFVKLRGDLVDNFRRNHKIKDEDTKARMAKKYSLGMDILS